jgi:hypothetical protein
VKHAPLLHPIWQELTYVIPVGQIAMAFTFMLRKFRVKALYLTIGVLMIFVLWIMSVRLFTGYLFWPYHAFGEKPTWMQKILISLGLCWLAFTAILLMNPKLSFKRTSSKSLRNKPANAQ